VTLDGQETPLIVRQQETFLAEFLEQRLDLGVPEGLRVARDRKRPVNSNRDRKRVFG